MSTPHPQDRRAAGPAEPGHNGHDGQNGRDEHDGHGHDGHGTSPGRLRRWVLLVSLAGLGLTAALVHADPSGTEHHELTAHHRRTHEAAGTRLPGGSRRLG